LVSVNTFLFSEPVHIEISAGQSYGCFLLLKNVRLCVVGLAPAHAAFKEEGGITAVDFNVGKSDRSEMKVTGKRKRVTKLL
jgi:hypothetical protein